ncbi:phytoene desaturase family protein [Verrucomicrobiota bacterium sgz303538]
MRPKQIIVVGAGPGGLASAMLLAARGFRVKVLERLPNVGGRTSTLEAHGCKWDLGPTFFLYPRILEEIFQACGHDLRAEVELVRLDPQYRIMFGAGGKIDATPDVARMEAEISSISPEDARNFRRFLDDNRSKLQGFMPILARAFNGLRDYLSVDLLRALPLVRPHLSVDGYLRSFFSDPRVRLAFSFQSKYLGMSPFRCPSLFSILSFLEYEYGVFHPIGGCGAVTAAMARVATKMGVDIHLDEAVEELVFDGRRVTGVRTKRGEYRADSLVVNADFARFMKRRVPNQLRRRWSDQAIEKKKFSCSTFMLYLAVEGQYELPHHTIHIAGNYEQNLDEIENRHVLSADPSFYVQNPCVTDPTLAPAGMSALYLLAPVSHQHPNIDWSRDRQTFRELLIRQAARAGYEDLEKRIRYERVITPDDWDTSYEIHQGATFNLAHSLSQLLHLRPRNRFEDLDGVYLVGGGTHPGSGLPVIFESARITTRLLLEDFGLEPNWTPVSSETPIAALATA